MRRLCSWCDSLTEGGRGPTTHTLCPTCALNMEISLMLSRRDFLTYCKRNQLPIDLAESLTRYVYDKVPPGSFLTAVLENHPILEVIRHGSPESVAALKALYVVLHNEVPMAWYGSALSVAEHLSPGSGRTRRTA